MNRRIQVRLRNKDVELREFFDSLSLDSDHDFSDVIRDCLLWGVQHGGDELRHRYGKSKTVSDDTPSVADKAVAVPDYTLSKKPVKQVKKSPGTNVISPAADPAGVQPENGLSNRDFFIRKEADDDTGMAEKLGDELIKSFIGG